MSKVNVNNLVKGVGGIIRKAFPLLTREMSNNSDHHNRIHYIQCINILCNDNLQGDIQYIHIRRCNHDVQECQGMHHSWRWECKSM